MKTTAGLLPLPVLGEIPFETCGHRPSGHRPRMRQHTDATKAQVLEHRVSGLSYILWTGPFEALGHRRRIGQRQPTVSKAAHWRVQVVHKTPIAARSLELAYSAHVNITPTALLPVDQGKRLCVASIMSARRKGSWANLACFHTVRRSAASDQGNGIRLAEPPSSVGFFVSDEPFRRLCFVPLRYGPKYGPQD